MRRRLKVNPLLESSASLLALAGVFRKADRGASVPANYRNAILGGFNEMERKAFELKVGRKVVREAKYALAAYIDEVVLTSSWPGRTEWMARPLQLEFFGEHLGGEGFFKHLNALRRGGERHAYLLEVYYVCLQLGFEGVYRLRGLEQLMALQVDLRSQIESYRGTPDPRLSPGGVPAESLIAHVRREVPYWAIGSMTLATVLFTYLAYTFVVTTMAEESAETVNALHAGINPDDRFAADRKEGTP